MSAPKAGLLGLILRYLGTLRFPYLVVVTAALFLLDLLIPDVIPYADEILLGLLALVLSRIKRRQVESVARPDRLGSER